MLIKFVIGVLQIYIPHGSTVAVEPFVSNIYKENLTIGSRDYDLCNRYAKVIQTIMISVPIMYSTAVMLYEASHFVAYFATGTLEPSIGVYYPSLIGYEELSDALMHLCNIVSAQIFIFVAFTFDQIVFSIFANVMMVPTIMKRDLQELKVASEIPKTTTDQIKSKLVQIIRMHWSYNE